MFRLDGYQMAVEDTHCSNEITLISLHCRPVIVYYHCCRPAWWEAQRYGSRSQPTPVLIFAMFFNRGMK